MTELGLLELVGRGQAAHYIVKATDNRPTILENRPMIIPIMTITPVTSMNTASITGSIYA